MLFQKQPWTAFPYGPTTYSLSHLDEFIIEAQDAEKNVRRIAVTCEDHCFTRDPAPEDDPALTYPGCSRNPGMFCVERYKESLLLKEHMILATKQHVWNVPGGDFAAIPVVDANGIRRFYGIHFSLTSVKGTAVELHMRIKSAYLCDEGSITTFGKVKFANLVTLRLAGRVPRRIMDAKRLRPKLPKA